MLFLVELDHVESGNVPSPDAGRGFIEQVIFPTLTLWFVAETRVTPLITVAERRDHVKKLVERLAAIRS